MTSAYKLEFAVKRLIIRDNHMLALHKPTARMFELPGGRMEFGETIEQTLQREMLEESGLHVQPLMLVDTWYLYREQYQLAGIIYLCSAPDDEQVVISDEHDAFEWLPIDQFARIHPIFSAKMPNWNWEMLKTYTQN